MLTHIFRNNSLRTNVVRNIISKTHRSCSISQTEIPSENIPTRFQKQYELTNSQLTDLQFNLSKIDVKYIANVEIKILDKIGIINFESLNSKVNVFNMDLCIKFAKALEFLNNNPDIDIIVFRSLKHNSFLAGADLLFLHQICENKHISYNVSIAFQNLIKMVLCSKPSVVIVNGDCFGAGLELALAANFCLATSENIRFGFPEARLGLVPGGLGSYLALKHLKKSCIHNLALVGNTFDYKKALDAKIITDSCIFSDISSYKTDQILRISGIYSGPDNFLKKSIRANIETTNTKGYFDQIMSRYYKNYCVKFHEKMLLFEKYRCHTLRHGLDEDVYHRIDDKIQIFEKINKICDMKSDEIPDEYCEYEARLFSDLLSEDLPRSILYGHSKKIEYQSLKPTSSQPHNFKKFGIVGFFGNIGNQLNELILKAKPEKILLFDKDTEFIPTYENNLYRKLNFDKYMMAKRRFTEASFHKTLTDIKDMKDVDFVFESVTEDLAVKKTVIDEIQQYNPDCIIGSTSSAFKIEQIAEDSKMKKNIIGVHVMSPIDKMKLVEIIPSRFTSDIVLQKTISLMEALGKICVVVKDSPGYFTTRVLMSMCIEIISLYERGIPPYVIDFKFQEFGFNYQISNLMDQIGLDVIKNIFNYLAPIYGEKYYGGYTKLGLVNFLVDHGALGRKSGEGILSYNLENKNYRFNLCSVTFNHYLIFIDRFYSRSLDHQTLFNNIILKMLNECCRCLEEGVIKSPLDGDIAAAYGFGFPQKYGGPFQYIDHITPAHLVSMLNDTSQTEECISFIPCQLLVDMSRDNKKFYEK